MLSGHGTPPDVTELFRRLVARHPDVAEGHYALGSAALRSENFALAVASARRATEIAPYWVPAKMLLARALIASGEEDAGLDDRRATWCMAPDAEVATHLEYALLLAGTGREDEARAMLDAVRHRDSAWSPARCAASACSTSTAGDLDAATARFEDLLSTGAQAYDALYFLGADRRAAASDTERALRYYSRVGGGDFALQAQGRAARIKAEQSGLDAGLAHLDEFARGHPQRGPDVVAARAGLAAAWATTTRALAHPRRRPRAVPGLARPAHGARVRLRARGQRIDAAIRDLRQLLSERPGDAVVQNALGYTLADRDRSLDEAAALVAAALAQMPDSAAVLDSMGWVLLPAGQPQEALPYLERARELGDDAEIDLHLGEVQWALGDQAAAREPPGSRRSSATRTTRASRSASSAPGREARGVARGPRGAGAGGLRHAPRAPEAGVRARSRRTLAALDRQRPHGASPPAARAAAAPSPGRRTRATTRAGPARSARRRRAADRGDARAR